MLFKPLLMKNLFTILPAVVALATSFYISPIPVQKAVKNSDTLASPLSVKSVNMPEEKKLNASSDLYQALDFSGNALSQDVFDKALKGFENLMKAGKLNPESHILTVCDFSKSSNTKRLWVIDTRLKKVLFNSLVAHGMGTGDEFAERFSNTERSHQSSLGFYITESVYEGSNGYSLKLLGMDHGFNDAALERAIVMHGADYVSDDFARLHKRIGRSWGCPVVPRDLAVPIINTIKGENCLFIYYPDRQYLESSQWLKDV